MGSSKLRRIGIFGGTFDPVHIGHLAAALDVRHALGLEQVLLVVANEPWQKVGMRELSPAEDRLAVVESAVAGIEGVEACRVEIDRGGPSYTVDTVEELRAAMPGTDMFLIVGSDVARDLGTWERVDELARMVTLVVMERAGAGEVEDPPGFEVLRVKVPAIELSSSEIRERIARGQPVDLLVPEDAIRCIRSRAMYAMGR